MKKIVYALVLAILLPLFSANAEKLSGPAVINNAPAKSVIVNNGTLITPRTDLMSQKYGKSLQTNEYYTKTIAGTPMGMWIGYGSATTSMVYDPNSGILVYTTYKTGTKGTDLYSTLNLYWSDDMGQNWSLDTLGSFTNEIVVAPSIVVSNDDNAANIHDLNIVTFSRYASKLSDGSYPWTGAYFQIRKGKDYQQWQTNGPEVGENSAFYLWANADMSMYKNNGDLMVTAASQLNPNKDYANAQYGTYGQASIDLVNYNNIFSIPNEWALSNFKLAPNFNSTYNSRMLVDNDNSGNVYCATFNLNMNNDNDSTRTPAVSKSTDGGNTWSTLNLCPVKVIEDYMKANNFYFRWPDVAARPAQAPVGSLVNWPWGAYTKNSFVATGKDEYSFITSMYCLYSKNNDKNDSLLGKTRMVEIYYKNKTWGINQIADLKYASEPLDVFQVDDASGNRKYDTLDANYDGFELLTAKTADGNDLVCTWVADSKLLKLSATVTLPIGTVDTVFTTDIFGAVRPLSGSTWTSVQFTNDDHYNKLIRMPKIVPNRNTIPMLGHDSKFSTTETVWTTYPAQFQNMNYHTFQSFYFMNFDFGHPEKYWPTSVEDQQAVNFTLNAPVPNPSNGMTELTFNLQEGAFTSLAVYNTLGVKVADLQNGFTSEGVHGLNINTESYVSGVYYVVLTAGSKSSTTLLNVVR